jgi:hypothetical protein
MKIFCTALLGILSCCANYSRAQTTAKIYTSKSAENPNKRSADGVKLASGIFVVTNAQGLLGVSNSSKDELVSCEYNAVKVLDIGYYALRKDSLWSLFYHEKQSVYGYYTNIEQIVFKNGQKENSAVFYLTNKNKCNIIDARGRVLFEWKYDSLRYTKDKKTGITTHYGIIKDKCYLLNIDAETESVCDCKTTL